MATTKYIKFLLVTLITLAVTFGLMNTAGAQWTPTPYTSAKLVQKESGAEARFDFWNCDSLAYPFVSKEVNVGKLMQDSVWITYFASTIAGDTARITFFGKFDYDSANVQRSKWDSCGTILIVGNTDSNQVKQVKSYFHRHYNELRVVIRRPSGGLPPILSSLSDRVFYITLTSKRNIIIPERPSYDSPYK